MNEDFSRGVAFILEGDTEKVFYLALLEHFCKKHSGWDLTKINDSKLGEVYYALMSEERNIVIKIFVVGTISQLAHSGTWFENRCHKAYPSLKWTVFLCYDTDDYMPNITKFYEGDWDELRKRLAKSKAHEVIDLAAQADIEDIMLLDCDGIFKFLGIAPCPIPPGSKGKRKMKRLFRLLGPGSAYHEGMRAKGLIDALDLDLIIKSAPLDFQKIEKACFFEIE